MRNVFPVGAQFFYPSPPDFHGMNVMQTKGTVLGEDGHRHGEADARDPHQQGAVLPVAVGHAQGPDPAGGLEQVGA